MIQSVLTKELGQLKSWRCELASVMIHTSPQPDKLKTLDFDALRALQALGEAVLTASRRQLPVERKESV